MSDIDGSQKRSPELLRQSLMVILLLLLMGWLSMQPRSPRPNIKHPFVDGTPITIYFGSLQPGATN